MNYQLPSRLLVAFSGVLAIAAFLFVLNVWVAVAFRQPLETVTPWLWFLPPDAWHLVNPGVFDNALKWGAAAGGTVLAVCLYVASQAPPGEPYGDARWAKRHEIAKAGLLDPSGVILGKLGGPRWFAPFIRSTRDKYCNTLLVAPPGGGKGVGVVIPTLLTWPGSAVVLDVKGENHEKTAARRKAMGDDVFVFSPLAEDGQTHRFNPLEAVAALEDKGRQYSELQRIAEQLLVPSGNADRSFMPGARELFIGAASAILKQENPRIGAVLKALAPAVPEDDAEPVSNSMSARLRVLANQAVHEEARDSLLQFAAYDPRSLATYLSVLKGSGLGAWANPAIDAATSANDFDLGSLRRSPQSIYIVIAPNDMKVLAPVARLFFQSTIAAMQARLPGPEDKLPFLLLLDEFKTLGEMEAVLNAAGTMRQYGGHMLIVVQGTTNLEEVYGQAGAQSLMNACQVHAYMSINDPKTKEMISRSLGTRATETVHESTSRQLGKLGGSRTRSSQTRAQKLLSEDAVNRIGEDAILLLAKDARPIKARKVIYYKDWRLKKLAAIGAGEIQREEHQGRQKRQERNAGDAQIPRPLLSQAQGFLRSVGIAKASLESQTA